MGNCCGAFAPPVRHARRLTCANYFNVLFMASSSQKSRCLKTLGYSTRNSQLHFSGAIAMRYDAFTLNPDIAKAKVSLPLAHRHKVGIAVQLRVNAERAGG